MTGPARLIIQIQHGDLTVHEFTRATAQPTADGVHRMCEAALGWLQAWSGQLSAEQWQADVNRAARAQHGMDSRRTDT